MQSATVLPHGWRHDESQGNDGIAKHVGRSKANGLGRKDFDVSALEVHGRMSAGDAAYDYLGPNDSKWPSESKMMKRWPIKKASRRRTYRSKVREYFRTERDGT